ncbi:LysR family transcriptional regulator [Nocardia miyunensis]|uniref:LysR family transcriptional regulator n=1 Tax=Nocardia miyunensis TaxID=282684 RepID=UPI0008371797|nr:LysR family transcriptional regulator [Nocardia miyunensis]
MNSRDLRYFVVAAKELHFTRAAESLFITQPALSKQIASLERELDARLFIRRRDGVALTPAGEALVEYARQIIDLDQEARHAVRRATSSDRTVTLGFWLAPGQDMLGKIIESFSAGHPETTLELRRGDWSKIGAGVECGESDVGLIWLGPGKSLRGLKFHRLGTEPMVVAVASGHRLATCEVLYPQDLDDETMFMVPAPSATFHAHGKYHPRGRARVVTTIDETLVAIASGLGICAFTASVARWYTHPGITLVPFEGFEPAEYCVVWREQDESRAEIQDLIHAIVHAWNSFLPTTTPS